MELTEIYNNIVMEHGLNSSNKHNLENQNCSYHGHNPNCGDDITLHLNIENGIIKDLSFTGEGCSISQSSTSVMIDLLRGKTIDKAKQLIDIFIKMIDRVELTEEEMAVLGDAVAFQNISNMPARVKCALLAWKTLQQNI